MIQNTRYLVAKQAILHPHLRILNISFIIIVITFLALGCGGGGGGGGTSDNTAPSVPSGLSAIAVSTTGIDLSWTASTDDTGVTEYRIFQNGIALPDKSATNSYSDTGLNDNTEYCYQVTAIDAAKNESALSIEACATTFEITRKLLATDTSAGDQFGFSVAMSGNYAIIGAQAGDSDVTADTGAAYIYQRIESDRWDKGIKIVAGDADANDRFGTAVAIAGDFAIVGSPGELSTTDTGAAYIFQRTGSGNVWDNGTKLSFQNIDADDEIGISVAISSNFAVIGSIGDDDAGTDSGAIYIYLKSGNTWNFQTKIPSPDAGAGDLFGVSVAISGDYIIAGATLADGNTGAAHIFHWTGSTWTSAKLIASGLDPGDFFGTTVAIDGDYAIVGARNDSDIESTAGAVYIYMKTGTNTWDNGVKITAEAGDIDAGDNFGKSVSISGDYAVIGADLDDEQTDSGTKISAFDFGSSDLFGNAVTISNDRAIVGAQAGDSGTADTGAVYIFDIPPI